jgi:hypothetical protein
MILSTLFHKGDLGTLYRCAVDRIGAVNTGKLTAIRGGDNETALALELQADRISTLAKKLETALCERPVFLSQDDLEQAAEAIEPLRRRVARTANRTCALELDAIRDKLIANIGGVEPEEY